MNLESKKKSKDQLLFNELLLFRKSWGLGIALKKCSHIKKIHTLLIHHECMKKLQKLNRSPEKYRKCEKTV